MKARDILTTDVITVSARTSVGDIARLLTRHRISAVPVVSGGRLAGILTRADRVELLARACERG